MVRNRNLIAVEEEDTDIIGPYHEYITAQQQKRIESYKWDEPDRDGLTCKIYPSSLKSIKDCPKEFIEVKVHDPTYFRLNVIESMEEGKAIHDAYEKALARIPNFIQKPDLSYYKEQFPGFAEMVERKNKDIFPEAYLYCPYSGTSLKVDIPKTNGVLIDLKTISCPHMQFDKRKDQWKTNCWSEEKTKLAAGKEDHRLQLAVYYYFTRKYKYWDMTHGRNVYFNTSLKRSDDFLYEAPKFEFTESMYKAVDLLFEHLIKHRKAWINNTTIECDYRLCSKHGGIKVG